MSEISGTHSGRAFFLVLKAVIRQILNKWLILAMGVACGLAYRFPDIAKLHGTIRAEYSILYGAVAVIFLISGLSVQRHKLGEHILNWRLHLLVQGISFLLVPAIMTAVIHLIHFSDTNKRLDTAVLAGYIFVSCLPTTLSSNVIMTKTAGGDDAAALVEVLVANTIGPFITPGWMMTLLPRVTDFDPWRHSGASLSSMYAAVFKTLGLTVLVPLVVGQIIRWAYPEHTDGVLQKFHFANISSICMVLLVWTSFSTCFATGAIESLKTETVILTVFFNIALYTFLTGVCFILAYPPKLLAERPVLRYIFYRLPPGEVVAICFCGAAKTSGLGIPLLYAMYGTENLFQNAQTSVAIVLYTTEQIFCANFVVLLLHRWNAKVTEKEASQGISNMASDSDPLKSPITPTGTIDLEKRALDK